MEKSTDQPEVRALVEELEDIELRRTGSGRFLEQEDTARCLRIERRLIQLLSADVPVAERREHLRVPCNFWVNIGSAAAKLPGVVVDIGVGGVFVETDLAVRVGDPVELEMERQPGTLQHGLTATGIVAWTGKAQPEGRPGLGIAFRADDPATEAKLRRFAMEIIRTRLAGFE